MGIGIIMVTDGAAGAGGPPMITFVGAGAPADANPAVAVETAAALRVAAAGPG